MDAENVCAVLHLLIRRHGYGKPLAKDFLVNNAPIPPHEVGKAKHDFEEMRSLPFIVNRGKRGIHLNNSEFGTLADHLYEVCEKEPWWIVHNLKHHYEGWDNHDWA